MTTPTCWGYYYAIKRKGDLVMNNEIIQDAMQPIGYINEHGETVTLKPEELLNIDNQNLDVSKLANDYFIVARLAERKALETSDLKTQLEALQGSLYANYLNNEGLKKMNGGKKPTETMLTSAINTTKSYQELVVKINRADYQTRVLKWLCKALEMKSNLYQTLSANSRAERKVEH